MASTDGREQIRKEQSATKSINNHKQNLVECMKILQNAFSKYQLSYSQYNGDAFQKLGMSTGWNFTKETKTFKENSGRLYSACFSVNCIFECSLLE